MSSSASPECSASGALPADVIPADIASIITNSIDDLLSEYGRKCTLDSLADKGWETEKKRLAEQVRSGTDFTQLNESDQSRVVETILSSWLRQGEEFVSDTFIWYGRTPEGYDISAYPRCMYSATKSSREAIEIAQDEVSAMMVPSFVEQLSSPTILEDGTEAPINTEFLHRSVFEALSNLSRYHKDPQSPLATRLHRFAEIMTRSPDRFAEWSQATIENLFLILDDDPPGDGEERQDEIDGDVPEALIDGVTSNQIERVKCRWRERNEKRQAEAISKADSVGKGLWTSLRFNGSDRTMAHSLKRSLQIGCSETGRHWKDLDLLPYLAKAHDRSYVGRQHSLHILREVGDTNSLDYLLCHKFLGKRGDGSIGDESDEDDAVSGVNMGQENSDEEEDGPQVVNSEYDEVGMLMPGPGVVTTATSAASDLSRKRKRDSSPESRPRLADNVCRQEGPSIVPYQSSEDEDSQGPKGSRAESDVAPVVFVLAKRPRRGVDDVSNLAGSVGGKPRSMDFS